MIDPDDYVNNLVPSEWIPETLSFKRWTFGELAQDRSTHWVGPDGKKFVMARQLLHIWFSIAPNKISDLAENEQPIAIQKQQIAMAMFFLYPSESKEKKKSVPIAIPI